MNLLKISAIFVLAAALAAISCAGGSSPANNSNQTTAAVATPNEPIPAAMPADELASAHEIFSKRCINCHTETGEGGVKEFDGKKIKVPNFKDPRVAEEPDEEYIEKIENGDRDGMPAFKGKISDEEIRNLVRLIRRDFQSK